MRVAAEREVVKVSITSPVMQPMKVSTPRTQSKCPISETGWPPEAIMSPEVKATVPEPQPPVDPPS